MAEELQFRKENGVGIITINRPEKKNAMLLGMRDEMAQIFTQVNDDDDVRVVIITGSGNDFCAGADIGEMGKGGINGSLERARAMNRLISSLGECSKPTIAAVKGFALGMGLSLALGCDYVVAGDSIRIGCVQSKIGLSPDAGNAWYLSRLLGTRLAKELIFSARMVKGEEALQLGLVTQLVKDEEVMDRAKAIAADLAGAPTLALSLAKKMLDVAPTMTISDFMNFEGSWLPLIAQSDDFKEGTRAFLEKRKPQFTGN
jgi:2-(1,2-epoxy-1,2-dihydrophenyl)acetyl-CoA isomerase